MADKIDELRQVIRGIASGTVQRVLNKIVDYLVDLGVEDAIKRKELEKAFLANILSDDDEHEEIIELTEIENGGEEG